MDQGRSSDVSPEAMQARIQQARREAETLKDRIKRKKDELADTTREYPLPNSIAACFPFIVPEVLTLVPMQSAPSPRKRTTRSRGIS